ncbi:MAG: SLC13 family permease [Candidatus Omnitrophota bacterium]
MPHKLPVILIFCVTYLLMMLKRERAVLIVYAGCFLLLAGGLIKPLDALSSVNLNVLGIFAGTMILSELFVFSNVPAFLAERIVSKSKKTFIALLGVCALTAIISSVVENVVTVLIVAPIALEVAKKLKVSPVPFLIGIAISANLQGCATMVGDSPSILLATSSGMGFLDFFWFKGRPGITFAVELGALGAFFVLYLFFKKYTQMPPAAGKVKIKTLVPGVLMTLLLLSLAAVSLLPRKPYYIYAILCLSFAVVGLIWHEIYHKESLSLLRDLDWKTLFFLIGIFVLVGSLTHAGIISDLAGAIGSVTKNNTFLAYSLVVWMSLFLSAFVDNIPYTMAMIPVAKLLAAQVGASPYLFLFGLLVGTCLGGNITPIGASANVAAIGFMKKHGYSVKFSDFFKIGFPFSVVAVGIAYIFLWFVWR